MRQLLVHELSPPPEPSEVCAALEKLRYRIFFDGTGGSRKYAQYSFVAADPLTVVTDRGGSCEVRHFSGDQSRHELVSGNALECVRSLLAEASFEPIDGLPPFQGGAAGFIGYEFASRLEQVPARPPDINAPDLCVGIYDSVFCWDRQSGRAWLVSQSSSRHNFFLNAWTEALQNRPRFATQLASGNPPPALSSLSRQEFYDGVDRIRDYISAGDIFQANFSQRFRASLNVPPWELYLALREHNPAPFSCFFDAKEISILSASPERFIKASHGRVETRPIKGTALRVADPLADANARTSLKASAKDNAEHVMIVDVLRNDLARVCKPGTVVVDELATLESHPTVHHLVSTITGELRNDCDVIDLLLATLPGGSVTGAPKIRAMQIISELEPVPRNVYCGCMLYITPHGCMDSSIIIRTFLASHTEVYFSAGGGIVADSSPALEYDETLHKAAALFSALQTVS